jgi:hypothetical protein
VLRAATVCGPWRLTNQIISFLAASPADAGPHDHLIESPAEELRAIQPIGNLPTDDRDVVAPLVALYRVRPSAVHLPLVQALRAGIEQRSADVMVDRRPI